MLSKPVNGYNKVRIKNIHIYDIMEKNIPSSIAFRYEVFNDSIEHNVLYERHVMIEDKNVISSFLSDHDRNLSSYQSMCRFLLHYIIEQGIETGTLERK